MFTKRPRWIHRGSNGPSIDSSWIHGWINRGSVKPSSSRHQHSPRESARDDLKLHDCMMRCSRGGWIPPVLRINLYETLSLGRIRAGRTARTTLFTLGSYPRDEIVLQCAACQPQVSFRNTRVRIWIHKRTMNALGPIWIYLVLLQWHKLLHQSH